MVNLATMFDCGINKYGLAAGLLFNRFITSGVSTQFERGNPAFTVGMSGLELFDAVIWRSGGGEFTETQMSCSTGKSPEYWAGWVLAYYQWKSCRRFSDIRDAGLDLESVISMYNPMHEAGLEKFYDVAQEIVLKNELQRNKLKEARKRLGLTQKDLAEASGVTLRMIRAYEQKKQDLSKAEYATVASLARVLMLSLPDA